MQDNNLEQVQDMPLADQPKEIKKKKRWIIILILLLLALCAGGGYVLYQNMKPQSKFDIDRNALEGFLPGKSEEEIQAELNRVIEEGNFNASINTQLTLEKKKLDVRIENVPANNYYMQVDIYLYPHQGSTEDSELIYQSGVIMQGKYIVDADAKTTVGPGVYDGIAVFHALTPDENLEEIGATAANVVIQVK